eukprot:4216456-Pleurochrysis_carterae.AAC.1
MTTPAASAQASGGNVLASSPSATLVEHLLSEMSRGGHRLVRRDALHQLVQLLKHLSHAQQAAALRRLTQQARAQVCVSFLRMRVVFAYAQSVCLCVVCLCVHCVQACAWCTGEGPGAAASVRVSAPACVALHASRSVASASSGVDPARLAASAAAAERHARARCAARPPRRALGEDEH